MRDVRNLHVRIADEAGLEAASPIATPRKETKKESRRSTKISTINTQEFQVVKDLSNQLQSLAVLRKKEVNLTNLSDLKELRTGIKKEASQRELQHLRREILVTVLNQAERRRLIRDYNSKQLSTEKELANLLTQHREHFASYIWKRKIGQQAELRQLFATGVLNSAHVGSLIAESSLNMIQSFERNSLANLCKDSINAGLCDADDIRGYLSPKILLLSPKASSSTQVHINRLSFENKDAPSTNPSWCCAYSTAGPWAVRLSSRCMLRELTLHSVLQLSRVNRQLMELRALASSAKVSKGSSAGQFSEGTMVSMLNSMMNICYVPAISRLLELLHPSHELQSLILQNPTESANILKARLISLGYEIPYFEIPSNAAGGGFLNDKSAQSIFDLPAALSVASQMDARISRELRFYVEFSNSAGAFWRAGIITMNSMSEYNTSVFPGYNSSSVGISSEGTVWHDGREFSYVQDLSVMKGIRTYGLIIDVFCGSLHLVVDGKILPPAFGRGAVAFSENDQESQRAFLMTHHLIPMFALQGQMEKHGDGNRGRQYGRIPMMKVNFGGNTFTFHPNAVACDNSLIFANAKWEFLDVSDYGRLEIKNGEDDGIKNAQQGIEKQTFTACLLPEPLRSFSHFPPSVYRRALAASIIQRAWRRYQGRKYRKHLRIKLVRAVKTLQRYGRKFLSHLHVFKNIAAGKIQKAWRIRLYRHYALLKIRYGRTLKQLNSSATVIQKAYRRWHVYRNSPIALRFKRKIEDVIKAAICIQRWWRPLASVVREWRKENNRSVAATTIQRVWRGYSLRQVLRPEVRVRLRIIGYSLYQNRDALLRIRAAYVLQKWWRKVLHRRVRSLKLSIRNRAAAKIQASWKGYWVRTHTHLRFSYAESVFLEAVCRGLRNAHFIIKMYKPCGIVCPS